MEIKIITVKRIERQIERQWVKKSPGFIYNTKG